MSIFRHPLFPKVTRLATVLAAIVVFVAGMAWIGNAQDHANDPQKLAVDVNSADWFEGGADASVTLVEYSDFQCPACGAYFPVVQELHDAFGDQLKIVYRNFPLTSLHKNAQLAAQAAEAAGIQGQFFAMHDLLFTNQKTWSDLDDPTETFKSYASSLGLNIDTFTADLTSDTVKKNIEDDVKGGEGANVSGTPTFFLDGYQIDNPQGLKPFTDVINAELAKVAAAQTEATPSAQ